MPIQLTAIAILTRQNPIDQRDLAESFRNSRSHAILK
jgi:hypothetical protein